MVGGVGDRPADHNKTDRAFGACWRRGNALSGNFFVEGALHAVTARVKPADLLTLEKSVRKLTKAVVALIATTAFTDFRTDSKCVTPGY